MRVAALVRCGVIGIGLLALIGCAKQQETEVTGSTNAAATPGSQQDFVVNVGDRVFFQTDSAELTTQARQTLDKQALWLNNYNRYAFTIEGHADERGTREYNPSRTFGHSSRATRKSFATRGRRRLQHRWNRWTSTRCI